MAFIPPTNIRQNLLHENIVEAAKLNPTYPYILSIESDNPDTTIEVISYKRFVSDAVRVAKLLQKKIPRRKAGTKPMNISVLAKSDYNFAIHLVACQFNNWGVSVSIKKKGKCEVY
jgi:hypothetical protein